MFNLFLSQIFKFFGVFFRTIKAFVLRQFRGITTRIRQLRNLSRGAAKIATSTVQSAASATQKPTKRSDYIEVGRLLIAKSFLLRLVVGLVILGVLIWFVIWPFILSHFLTARFYVGDSRVRNWSGKVIVFSDTKKKVPLYSGTLEKGVLQGEGRDYDESGVCIYEGTFQNGLYNGTGREYTNGILSYEGQFANGVYEGSGTKYADGTMLYSGQFSEGSYEGRGALYDDGILRYEGQFANGLYEGRGILYSDGNKSYEGNFEKGVATGEGASYIDRILRYQGQFSDGLPSGSGKEYGPDGRLTYEGEFAAGVYNGQGIAYPTQGWQLEASFTDGEPEGTVRWSKNGALYYEGEWSDGAPSGFGKLYNRAGETLYQGQFSGGTLDGAWMLSLTADELRQAFGTDHTSSYQENIQSFFISSPELGVIGRCNYRTGSSESEVYSVYISPPVGPEWFNLLPGEDNVATPEWPEEVEVKIAPLQFNTPNGVNAPQGVYHSVMAFEPDKDLRTTLLYTVEGAQPASVLTWSRLSALPQSEQMAAGISDTQKMDKFLGALDGMEKNAGGGLPDSNPYYGNGKVSEALSACESAEQAGLLTDALVEYWRLSEQQKGLEDNLNRIKTLQAEEQSAISMGNGTEGLVESLEEEKLALEAQILNAQSARKQAELEVQQYGPEPSELAVDTMLLLFDPAGLDLDDLALMATAWVQAQGATTSAGALELEIKSLLVSLQDAYSAMENARSRFEAAGQAVQSAAGGYAMGTTSKATWYGAMSSRTEAQLALYDALSSFTKYANALNQKTAGWISRTYDWYPDEFVFTVEQPEPAETADEAAETAEEAAEGGV